MAPLVGSILLTSYGTLDSMVNALELGISGFVMKPVTSEQLVEAVKGAITRSVSSYQPFRLRALEALDEMSGIILIEKDEGYGR